jgi:myosin heavy subunit
VQPVLTADGPAILIDDREAVLQDEITMRFQLQ